VSSYMKAIEARCPSRCTVQQRRCRDAVPLRGALSLQRQRHPCSTGSSVAGALLVLFLSCMAAPSAQARTVASRWSWPLPWHSNDTSHSSGEEVNQKWAETLRLVWDKSKDHVGFCVGRSQEKAQRLMVGRLRRAS
jgi:hypothetical protein